MELLTQKNVSMNMLVPFNNIVYKNAIFYPRKQAGLFLQVLPQGPVFVSNEVIFMHREPDLRAFQYVS